MKRSGLAVILLFGLALLVAGCGQIEAGPGTGNSPIGGTGSSGSVENKTVHITASGFNPNQVTIKEDQAIVFVNDPDSGKEQTVCLGQNGRCDDNAKGPSPLQGGGIFLRNGMTNTVAFPQAGTYSITAYNNANMNLTVRVTQA